jgi:acyl-CoA reductase-like NAD-dependent aldehyde dehydrogenase
VLYRVAEVMEGRRAQFVELTGDEAEVDAAIDTWVWYAGWADKLAQVLGSSNPVAGPYFNFTLPEPTGVVGVVAPEEPALTGFVAHLAPAIVGGNAVVIVASQKRPLAAVTLAEVLATSDVPGGVVNVLTGRKDELCSVLAAHMDVNAIDLSGAGEERAELERLAADNVKRVVSNGDGQSPWHVAAFLELKTVWHPIGV